MGTFNKNKIGLIFGIFLAVMHALWSLAVAVMPGYLQKFLDWAFELHSLKPIYVITSFNLVNAILLVALTFVVGYVFGWVFAVIWNWVKKGEKHKEE